MTDDIVTRLRDRAKERIEANEEYWRGHKFEYEIPILEDQAADEIERLRADLQRSALQTNVMRNIATAPYGDASEQILDLGAELAECQSEYQKLWRKYNRLVRGD